MMSAVLNWECALIIPFLCSLNQSLALECRHVETIQCHKGKESSILLSQGQLLTCRVEYTNDSMRASEKDKTAPKASNLHANWYIHNNRNIQIAVSWKQKEKHLTSGYVEEYHLSDGNSLTFKISLKVGPVQTNITKLVDCVEFNFTRYPERRRVIKPGQSHTFLLYPIPVWHKNMTRNRIKTSVSVPKCKESRDISLMRNRNFATQDCKDFWKEKIKILASFQEQDKETTVSQRTTIVRTTPKHVNVGTSFLYYWVPIIVLSILVILIIFLFFRSRQSGVLQKEKEYQNQVPLVSKKKILLVADYAKRHNMEDVQALATFLMKNNRFTITSNWQYQQKITSKQLQWYSMAVDEADVVVFIVENFDRDNFLDTQGRERDDGFSREFKSVKNYALTKKWEDQSRKIIVLANELGDQEQSMNKIYTLYKLGKTLSENDDFYLDLLGEAIKGVTIHNSLACDFDNNNSAVWVKENGNVSGKMQMMEIESNTSENEANQPFINTGARPKIIAKYAETQM